MASPLFGSWDFVRPHQISLERHYENRTVSGFKIENLFTLSISRRPCGDHHSGHEHDDRGGHRPQIRLGNGRRALVVEGQITEMPQPAAVLDALVSNHLLLRDLIDDVPDEPIKKGIEAARERQRKHGVSTLDRLCAIAPAQGDEDLSGELTTIIAEMEIDKKQGAEVRLLYDGRNRYSRAIADGLLHRVSPANPKPRP